MVRASSRTGKLILMVSHCAGMLDLVALPVWIGTLIGHYRFDPQEAGGLVTLFLLGAVLGSAFFASRSHRISARWATVMGYGVSAVALFATSQTSNYLIMAMLHAAAGLSAGSALSFTHGTIGRSQSPHRLFAAVGIALGIFAVVFLGSTPALIARAGGPALFVVFGGVMAIAALLAAITFPLPDGALHSQEFKAHAKLEPAVWFGVVGISLMALTQAMIFSFVERIGVDRGFGMPAVHGVLLAIGLVNMFPALLAGLLEHRLAAHRAVVAGAVLQAVIALMITSSVAFPPYAVATSVFAFVMLFTHTFAFGLLARLDPSGRVVAATPAMLMIGAAIGPVVGGTLVKTSGYATLGTAALLIAALAVACFSRLRLTAPGFRPAPQ